MTKQQLLYTLNPYCMGKEVLLDYVQDIWNSSTPVPNSKEHKIIHPIWFKKFCTLLEQENGIYVSI